MSAVLLRHFIFWEGFKSGKYQNGLAYKRILNCEKFNMTKSPESLANVLEYCKLCDFVPDRFKILQVVWKFCKLSENVINYLQMLQIIWKCCAFQLHTKWFYALYFI